MLLKSLGLGELPKNSLLLIEEDLGEIKSTFLQLLVLDSLKNGQKALYISTRRSAEDILEEIELIGSTAKPEMKKQKNSIFCPKREFCCGNQGFCCPKWEFRRISEN